MAENGDGPRELLSDEDLQEIEFGDAIIIPRQTRYYPCNWWSNRLKCTHPNRQSLEETLRTKWNTTSEKERRTWKDKPCTGIKPDCKYFEYPLPYVPSFDELYVIDEDVAETICYALRDGDNLLVVGPPGCGKSSSVLHLLSLLNWECNRFSCTDQLTTSKIIGQWVVAGDEMAWIDGHVTDALRWGKVLLEEEADFMDPALRGELHTIQEQGGSITLHRRHPKTGQVFRETIEKHKDFRWVSTANTIGLGDDSFMFHGTQFMNAAARDRYETILQMDYPAEDTEADIIITKVNFALQDRGLKLENNTARQMVEVANAVRNAFKSRQCNFAFTIRRTLAWGKYWLLKGPDKGSKLAVMNFCSPQDQMVVSGFIETIMGHKID